jgi:hypothetical protein
MYLIMSNALRVFDNEKFLTGNAFNVCNNEDFANERL